MWDRGARSPEAPSEPFSGITGCTPAFSMLTRVSTSSGRTPEDPWHSALARSSSIARTASAGRGRPQPTAWLTIRLCCSRLTCSAEIRTLLSAPKPVLMPYTARPSRKMPSTISRERRIAGRASPERDTLAPHRATATTCSRVR